MCITVYIETVYPNAEKISTKSNKKVKALANLKLEIMAALIFMRVTSERQVYLGHLCCPIPVLKACIALWIHADIFLLAWGI